MSLADWRRLLRAVYLERLTPERRELIVRSMVAQMSEGRRLGLPEAEG